MCLITAQKYVFSYNYPKKTKENNAFLCKIVKYYAQNKYSLGLNSLSATSYPFSYVYIKQFFALYEMRLYASIILYLPRKDISKFDKLHDFAFFYGFCL